ncbi:MAG: hypothetical protein KAQ89_05440 [Planctomycetes bacterium]|nr:hypothetical protein [Planctomycetota bacterium]MCK5614480.1 hypothetical protein [Candidatus Pacearchaeota archaeon]
MVDLENKVYELNKKKERLEKYSPIISGASTFLGAVAGGVTGYYCFDIPYFIPEICGIAFGTIFGLRGALQMIDKEIDEIEHWINNDGKEPEYYFHWD